MGCSDRLNVSRDYGMPAFLKIENPGQAPIEGFTVLGVSLADTSNNVGVIGQFGSGNKHAVAVLLRNELSPVVFAGTLKMEFSTRPQTVTDGIASKEFGRVVVKFGGTDPVTGASRSSTEDLGFVLSYGDKDWTEVALALREFVSNSIDRSIREIGDWSAVKIEVVSDSQVRAKAGYTRVFVPLTTEVLQFYNDLGKWFLHFSEPESLDKAILPKNNRNLGDRNAAVIYRRGVRVREFEASDTESLFDYNLNDLTLDEARIATDWNVKYGAAKALASANKQTLAILFDRLLNSDKSAWEFSFDSFSMQPSYGDSPEVIAERRKNWSEAFALVAGDDGVLTGKGTANQLERKGYVPVIASENLVSAAGTYGVQTSASVLSVDELSGRQISEPTPDAQAAVDLMWELLEGVGLTNGKQKPPVKVFTSILNGGVQLNGYYRSGEVFINADLAGTGSVGSEHKSLSHRLLVVALEELSHFVTEAGDNSRDFQNFLLDVTVKLARLGEEKSGDGRGQRNVQLVS